MLDNILELTKQFIPIDSRPGNKKALDKILSLALSNLEGFTIEKFEKNSIKSALVYNTEKRPEIFKILLSGHLDIIPGKDAQYSPRIEGDKLYGVGSMDMKANIACLIMAYKEVVDKVDYPLGLQLVTDEEVGGFDGAKYQVDEGVRADFVIAGEPTNFDIVNKAKGVLWLEISATGKTAHGAYPWRGDNAIWKINEFLNRVKKKFPITEKEAWVTAVNLSMIETSNKAFNKIPDDCTIKLDVRFTPEDKATILNDIKDLLPEGLDLTVVTNEPALNTADDDKHLTALHGIVKQLADNETTIRGAHGTSDARHFTRVDCAGVEFGPIGGGIGSDDEWADIPSLETYYNILVKFLLSLNK